MTQLEVDYEAARKVATTLDDAQTELEASAPTMPSSGKYGDGEQYIAFMISLYAEASGAFAQAAEHGASAARTGVDLISGADAEVTEDLTHISEELSHD